MSKARVVVHEAASAEEARRALVQLLAMGLGAEALQAVPSPRPLWEVSVPEEEAGSALALLEEARSADAQVRPAPLRPPAVLEAGIWTWTNSAASLVIAAICIAIHLVVHGLGDPASRSAMVEAGAVAPWLVREGQWWRLLTAAFLHFDLKHLVGNLSALLFLGPPLAAQIGNARMAGLFVVTAVAGNVASQVLGNEAAVKAGASGGICGLLGALAGVALAAMAAAEDARERRPAWQTLGALVALFGMIVGFEPGNDHYAHVGGVLVGVAIGRAIAPPPVRASA